MNTFWKAFGITVFFFTMVAGVVFLANFRLNLYHDAFYESPVTKTVAPSLVTKKFWHNLYRWDAGWYWDVVTKGYTAENATFFPLYPLALRGLMNLQPNNPSAFPNAAIVISVAAVFSITTLMITLAKREGHSDTTFAALLLLFFPTAMFLAAPYTEGLFIALLLGFVLAIQKQKWWLALIVGILLGLTRVSGVTLILYPLYLAWTNRDNRANLKWYGLAIAAPLIGIGILAAYQYHTLDNALAFITTQNSWGRTTTFNLTAIAANYAKNWQDFMSLSMFHPRFIGWGMNYIFTALGLGLTTWLWFVRREYSVIALGIMALPLLSGTTHSFPRLLLPAIPLAALVVADKLKNPTARTLLLIACVAGWTFFLVLFTRGYWVA